MDMPESRLPNATPKELASFYSGAAESFRAQGITAYLTSGQACIRYRLTQFSKDSDWIIKTEKNAIVLDALAEMVSPDHTKPLYTIKYGAPFDPEWTDHGWSSHIFFPDKTGGIGARIDMFTNPPRTNGSFKSDDWPAVDRHTVACMKKTQRDKDWPFVHQLGLQLCQAGDCQGLLHLQTRESIAAAIKNLGSEIAPAVLEARPLLQLFLEESQPDFQDTALLSEKEFWKEADRQRLGIFAAAWEPYGAILAKRAEPKKGPLLKQHALLKDIARVHLPANPLGTLGSQPDKTLRNMVAKKITMMFSGIPDWIFPNSKLT